MKKLILTFVLLASTVHAGTLCEPTDQSCNAKAFFKFVKCVQTADIKYVNTFPHGNLPVSDGLIHQGRIQECASKYEDKTNVHVDAVSLAKEFESCVLSHMIGLGDFKPPVFDVPPPTDGPNHPRPPR